MPSLKLRVPSRDCTWSGVVMDLGMSVVICCALAVMVVTMSASTAAAVTSFLSCLVFMEPPLRLEWTALPYFTAVRMRHRNGRGVHRPRMPVLFEAGNHGRRKRRVGQGA